jgi:hypothetical protein
VLESFVYRLGECKFNAPEFVVGSNHETSSTLKKDSITFCETSVRIYKPLCPHTRRVLDIDSCMLRHRHGQFNGLWIALSWGWHRPIRRVTLYVISYTLVHMLTVSHLTLNTYFYVAYIIIYLGGNTRRGPEHAGTYLDHSRTRHFGHSENFSGPLFVHLLRHFRVIASVVSFLACPQKHKLSSECCYVLRKCVKTLTLWPPLPSKCSGGERLNTLS